MNKKEEIADYLEYHNFIEEMRLYLERLQNGRDYSPWIGLTEGSTVVQVSMAKNNRLTIKPYESNEELVKELQTKIEYQEQTIKEQAKEIKSFKKEAKQTATEKIELEEYKPRRRSKRTENP